MTLMLTNPEWGKETGGLEVAKAFAEQIRGKNILITGISPESIGSSTAFGVASQTPGLLILASRTVAKLNEVSAQIQKSYPGTKIEIVELDLGSQGSIRTAASNIARITDKIDVVINNAGLMVLKRQYTNEGIEAQFGVNHIGHFLLTNLLKQQLLIAAQSNAAGATRVVNLTSLGHRLSPVRFSDFNLEKNNVPQDEMHGPLPPMFAKSTEDGYNGFVAYGQAKTANILFSVGLNEQLRDSGIASYAVHPGSIWTGLSRDLDPDGEEAIRKTSTFWKSLDQGAATTLVAAFDPKLTEQHGVLLHDCQMTQAAPYATDPSKAQRLWQLSESLVQGKLKL